MLGLIIRNVIYMDRLEMHLFYCINLWLEKFSLNHLSYKERPSIVQLGLPTLKYRSQNWIHFGCTLQDIKYDFTAEVTDGTGDRSSSNCTNTIQTV